MKLPIKTRILEWAILHDAPFTAQELSDVLKIEYNGERTTTVQNIFSQLETYCRVNFMKTEKIEVDKSNNLVVIYTMTEIGNEKIKYIPGHGNKSF